MWRFFTSGMTAAKNSCRAAETVAVEEKDECEKTERGRFLGGCLGLTLDDIYGGDLEQDGKEVMENLAASREEDIEFLLAIGASAGQMLGQENTSKFIARIGELIPPNHPDAAMLRAKRTVLALMNADSVSPEELEAAISYCTEALDDPKRVMDAAATLPYMLHAMGLVGVYPERIKALAKLLEEKRRMSMICRIPSIRGSRMFFMISGNTTRRFPMPSVRLN